MPEQTVKTVNFDVCKKAPKLIGYHQTLHIYFWLMIDFIATRLGLSCYMYFVNYMVHWNFSFTQFNEQ